MTNHRSTLVWKVEMLYISSIPGRNRWVEFCICSKRSTAREHAARVRVMLDENGTTLWGATRVVRVALR
jgi:hypothetical protein